MAEPASSEDAPRRFGRYVLARELWVSAWCTVWSAADTESDSAPVTVKRVHPALLRDPDAALRLLEAARLGAKLAHPNLLATREVLAVGAEVVIVTEAIDGVPLREILRAAASHGVSVPAPVAVRIALELLAALETAHDASGDEAWPDPITPLDLTPENVVMTSDGAVKLLDVTLERAAVTLTSPLAAELVGYRAPERLQGAGDQRSDLFLIGVLLWELLADKPLFTGSHIAEAVRKRTIPRLDEAGARAGGPVGSKLAGVVARSLTRATAGRFPSADHMGQALMASGAAVASPEDLGALVERVKRARSVSSSTAGIAAKRRELLETPVVGTLISPLARVSRATGTNAAPEAIGVRQSVATTGAPKRAIESGPAAPILPTPAAKPAAAPATKALFRPGPPAPRGSQPSLPGAPGKGAPLGAPPKPAPVDAEAPAAAPLPAEETSIDVAFASEHPPPAPPPPPPRLAKASAPAQSPLPALVPLASAPVSAAPLATKLPPSAVPATPPSPPAPPSPEPVRATASAPAVGSTPAAFSFPTGLTGEAVQAPSDAVLAGPPRLVSDAPPASAPRRWWQRPAALGGAAAFAVVVWLLVLFAGKRPSEPTAARPPAGSTPSGNMGARPPARDEGAPIPPPRTADVPPGPDPAPAAPQTAPGDGSPTQGGTTIGVRPSPSADPLSAPPAPPEPSKPPPPRRRYNPKTI